MLNIRQRRQRIASTLAQQGGQTIREIARATGIPKSSVHRHQQAIKRGRELPESALWETSVGEEWLKRLVVSAIYVFGLKRGVGAESLCEFFQKLHLEHQIGVSVSSVRKIQSKLEEEILNYQKEQHQTLSQKQESVSALCVAMDETWFEQTVLVMMDLSSGYLLVEERAENQRYESWKEPVQRMLQQWGFSIKYCVNDRAKALLKLALADLGCPSIADLFHAMRKLSQSVGFELERRLTHLRRRLREEHEKSAPNEAEGEVLNAEYNKLVKAQSQFRQILMQISLELHPFDTTTLLVQSTLQVASGLHNQVEQLKQFRQEQNLQDNSGGIDKFKRQIDDLAQVVDLWWQWVEQSLASQALAQTFITWLMTVLLPCCYWECQTQRTDKPALRIHYQEAWEQAQLALKQHPLTLSLDPATYDHWYAWACEMVMKFQRTSSPVEGRNGYLSQIHHNTRGLSPRRLQVMTVLHNFDLQRADGSTAAQRLFKQPQPDLFLTVLAHMPELPLPRKRSKLSVSTTTTVSTVPA